MRMNFSHGDFAEHQVKVDNARAASEKIGIPVALLQDLGGSKIRIGDFYKESIVLEEEPDLYFDYGKNCRRRKKVYINYAPLPKEVKVGGFIMLHDGKRN